MAILQQGKLQRVVWHDSYYSEC